MADTRGIAFERRTSAGKVLGVTARHHRQPAVTRPLHTAGHRRVDKTDATLGQQRCGLPRGINRYRTVIHHHAARRQHGGQSLHVVQHVLISADTEHDQLAVGELLAVFRSANLPFPRPVPSFFNTAVADRLQQTGAMHMTGHRCTHRTQADEATAGRTVISHGSGT